MIHVGGGGSGAGVGKEGDPHFPRGVCVVLKHGTRGAGSGACKEERGGAPRGK